MSLWTGLVVIRLSHRLFRWLITYKKKTTRLSGWPLPLVVFVSWAAIVSVVLGSSLVFALFKIHCEFAGDGDLFVLLKFCSCWTVQVLVLQCWLPSGLYGVGVGKVKVKVPTQLLWFVSLCKCVPVKKMPWVCVLES